MSQFTYVGTELELFAAAQNWKNYVFTLIAQYIEGDVLEVGAGIGRNTCLFCHSKCHSWLCLEPDINLFQDLQTAVNSYGANNCYFQNGTIDSLSKEQLFDSILYLDVLEHIFEDQAEVIKAYYHLKNEGYLIILAPAHQRLFTPFDTAIGHHRRYSKSKIAALLPDSIEVVKLIYLDCVGLLASLGNKLILRQKQPTLLQIKLWDRVMVPTSKRLDAVLKYKLGKSVLLIGRKVC